MSLGRLALRLATVEALLGGGPPFPTIAGPLVFDSKADDIEQDKDTETLPCILVFTDKDEQIGRNVGGGVQFTGRQVSLEIECVIASFGKGVMRLVETDAECEAMLDIFEWQVWRALNDPIGTHNRNFRRIVKGIEAWASDRAEDKKEHRRYAVRRLSISVNMKPDCLPSATIGPPGVLPQPASLLPVDAPWLEALVASVNTNPDFATLREQLREAMTGVPSRSLPPLRSIHTGFFTKVPDGDGPAGVSLGSRVDVVIRTEGNEDASD